MPKPQHHQIIAPGNHMTFHASQEMVAISSALDGLNTKLEAIVHNLSQSTKTTHVTPGDFLKMTMAIDAIAMGMDSRLAQIEHELRFQRNMTMVLNHNIQTLIKEGTNSMTTLAEILTKATALDTAAGAFALFRDDTNKHIADLEGQLKAAQDNAADPGTLDAIASQLDQAKAALAGATAVVANTEVASSVGAPAQASSAAQPAGSALSDVQDAAAASTEEPAPAPERPPVTEDPPPQN
jgi:hypothetical protein